MKSPRKNSRVTLGNPRSREEIHDPYRARRKYPEPTICSGCGAVYRNGRWQWIDEIPEDARELRCPACRRIADKYPAGEVILTGTSIASRRDELLRLVRNAEDAENREHPLHRIMDISEDENRITITTTDVHLPRRIGHALEDAWNGELETHYDEEGAFARIVWRRND